MDALFGLVGGAFVVLLSRSVLQVLEGLEAARPVITLAWGMIWLLGSLCCLWLALSSPLLALAAMLLAILFPLASRRFRSRPHFVVEAPSPEEEKLLRSAIEGERKSGENQ